MWEIYDGGISKMLLWKKTRNGLQLLWTAKESRPFLSTTILNSGIGVNVNHIFTCLASTYVFDVYKVFKVNNYVKHEKHTKDVFVAESDACWERHLFAWDFVFLSQTL